MNREPDAIDRARILIDLERDAEARALIGSLLDGRAFLPRDDVDECYALLRALETPPYVPAPDAFVRRRFRVTWERRRAFMCYGAKPPISDD